MASEPGGRTFRRPYTETLASRLLEPRRFIQVVSGAGQVGKTTEAFLARPMEEIVALTGESR